MYRVSKCMDYNLATAFCNRTLFSFPVLFQVPPYKPCYDNEQNIPAYRFIVPFNVIYHLRDCVCFFALPGRLLYCVPVYGYLILPVFRAYLCLRLCFHLFVSNISRQQHVVSRHHQRNRLLRKSRADADRHNSHKHKYRKEKNNKFFHRRSHLR